MNLENRAKYGSEYYSEALKHCETMLNEGISDEERLESAEWVLANVEAPKECENDE